MEAMLLGKNNHNELRNDTKFELQYKAVVEL